MEYTVNGAKLNYEAAGPRAWGEEHVLLHNAVDLTSSTPWHKQGFTIERLFDAATFEMFVQQTQSMLIQRWKDAGLNIEENFTLDQYHKLIPDSQTHLNTLEKSKLLYVEDFPVPIQLVEGRISEICQMPLVAKNPWDNQSVFHFRVIRPMQQDNNPLHRDIWLEDYDDCINLYIPIAGSNEQSSLIIIPGSHLWPESRIEKTQTGAEINGVKFNVPAVTDIRDHYEIIRPDPLPNEVLVFSPYLIHGGAVNLSEHHTRISIEMRLWKR